MDLPAQLSLAGEVCFLGMVARLLVLARRQDDALADWALARAVTQDRDRNDAHRKRGQAEATQADSTGEPVTA